VPDRFFEAASELNKMRINRLKIKHSYVIRVSSRLQRINHKQSPGSIWAAFIYLRII
jgi:hypothetical protein